MSQEGLGHDGGIYRDSWPEFIGLNSQGTCMGPTWPPYMCETVV